MIKKKKEEEQSGTIGKIKPHTVTVVIVCLMVAFEEYLSLTFSKWSSVNCAQGNTNGCTYLDLKIKALALLNTILKLYSQLGIKIQVCDR